ncbi:MAG: F0F1 ATP synthase subunit delta [Lysobacterales bacterium]|nr:MAG: F0F1 ATP synthase subunit delta [Xanthomonadales bacterium]
MSSVTTLARPYAKAAFALAQDEQAHDSLALARWEDMLALAAAVASDATMAAVLDSPHVSPATAVKLIADTAGDALNARFRDFLSVLAGNDRLQLLPEIARLFRRLRAKAERRLQVRVVSAVPLDAAQSARMREALAKRYACQIELDNEIDRDVIGGAVIYAGDEVIDGSLRGRLQKLSGSLVR